MPLVPIEQMPIEVGRGIRLLFTDIDDTLTLAGRIPAAAFAALWQAHQAGISVVPVTGRPAGWCDHIARMWPVAAVVGENGALAFSLDRRGRMRRIFAPRDPEAAARLQDIGKRILAEVPGCRIAADQPFRMFDLAVDFREEVAPLAEADIERIVAIFEEHGATARVSSIHVNGYFGEFDKLSMCRRCAAELLGQELEAQAAVFVGDSPNDEPAFAFFPNSIGVANVRHWLKRMRVLPAYITSAEGGLGFAEAVEVILSRRANGGGSS